MRGDGRDQHRVARAGVRFELAHSVSLFMCFPILRIRIFSDGRCIPQKPKDGQPPMPQGAAQHRWAGGRPRTRLHTHKGFRTTQFALVSTKAATRANRLATIAALTPNGPNIDVARTILSAVLYRNDGLHNGMASWAEAELHEAARVFLTAMMFCRKNLFVSPPTP